MQTICYPLQIMWWCRVFLMPSLQTCQSVHTDGKSASCPLVACVILELTLRAFIVSLYQTLHQRITLTVAPCLRWDAVNFIDIVLQSQYMCLKCISIFLSVCRRQRPTVHILQLDSIQRFISHRPEPARKLHLQLHLQSGLSGQQCRVQPKVDPCYADGTCRRSRC